MLILILPLIRTALPATAFSQNAQTTYAEDMVEIRSRHQTDQKPSETASGIASSII